MVIKYLSGLDYNLCFDIRATDLNIEYVGNVKEGIEGQAYKNYLEVQLEKRLPIVNIYLKQGDMFNDKLHSLLSLQDEELNSFSLVYLSHAIYHAASDERSS